MRIAIVGAGIGGLAAALALARPDRTITLYERRTGFTEAGAGIQLGPNATRILAALGLGGALARHGREPDAITVRALPSGRSVGHVALGAFMRERFGSPYIAIARSDLHTGLLDAVRGRTAATVRVGRRAIGVADSTSAVDLTVETETGHRETASFDLIVAADGVRSALRPAIGDARAPRYRGYAAYRSSVPAADCDVDPAEGGLWLGRGRHAVHYGVASGTRINLVVVGRRAMPLGGWSDSVGRDDVARALGEAPAQLRGMVEGAEPWLGWSLYDLPTRSMGAGRVALLGDAAHPILPYLAQGAGLAIEDAASLAAVLADREGDPASAVRHYGRHRLRRVRRVQSAANANGRIYHAGAPVAWMRDAVMAQLGSQGMAERLAWLYGWTTTGQA